MSRDQQVIDALTAAIPRAQLAVSSLQRTHDDVAAILESLALAATLLKPLPPHESERHITTLDLAITRSSRTVDEVAFVAGLSPQRLRALMAGAPATAEEVDGLRRCLPDWQQQKPR